MGQKEQGLNILAMTDLEVGQALANFLPNTRRGGVSAETASLVKLCLNFLFASRDRRVGSVERMKRLSLGVKAALEGLLLGRIEDTHEGKLDGRLITDFLKAAENFFAQEQAPQEVKP